MDIQERGCHWVLSIPFITLSVNVNYLISALFYAIMSNE